jgi:FtsP/CotA-like multicopper oxidase with cupredoxin domain
MTTKGPCLRLPTGTTRRPRRSSPPTAFSKRGSTLCSDRPRSHPYRIPDSGTINGKGRYDPLNLTASANTLYTLKVKRGKRYRLRIINASAIASFRFSIHGHKLTVIEADGIATKPIEVDAFDILVGQRYSVIVRALSCLSRWAECMRS